MTEGMPPGRPRGGRLRGLVKDKRVMYVGGAGVLMGAYVLMRRRGASAGTSAAATTSSGTAAASGGTTGGAAGGGYLGAYTDGGVGAYQNIQNSMDTQLDQFRGQLSSVLDQLATLTPTGTSQSGTPGTTPTTSTPGRVSVPSGETVTPIKAPAVPSSVIPVTAFRSTTNYTADSVARRYGITTAQLQALNPGHNVLAGITKGATVNVPLAPVRK